jgi:hypothetical protein
MRRAPGSALRSPRTAALAGALAILVAGPAGAQVGHDPARSPYRTLRYGQFMGLTGGYFNGDGGSLGAAPHRGATAGFRYDFLGAGTVSLGLSATWADLERLIIDPSKPIARAVTGPVKQSAVLAEGILQFNLTGGKTWHRISPFVSTGAGLVVVSQTPADTSGFKFRTRIIITPGIGARIFLSERLFLRLEARNTFWSVSYPESFRAAPSSDPTQPPVLTGSSGKEWSATGWYTFGLSYAFHRPF